jgi:hypothetical protein
MEENSPEKQYVETYVETYNEKDVSVSEEDESILIHQSEKYPE